MGCRWADKLTAPPPKAVPALELAEFVRKVIDFFSRINVFWLDVVIVGEGPLLAGQAIHGKLARCVSHEHASVHAPAILRNSCLVPATIYLVSTDSWNVSSFRGRARLLEP
jgi:hypothetical protein